jgi:hypothetical protein
MKNKRPSLPYLILCLILILACQPVNEQLLEATQVPDEPGVLTPTATPFPGGSRALPFVMGQTVQTENWEIQVLETIRGEAAWEQAYEANYFNEPPATDEEFLLVKYRIHNNNSSSKEQSISLHVTGSSLQLHRSFDSDLVEPKPHLETYLAGGQGSEGWEAYRIRSAERNLMVVINDSYNYEEPTYYLALEEGAAISISEDSLESVTKTNIGRSLAEPALLGQMTTGNNWQLDIDQIIVGEEAWKMAFDTNQFNDPPPKGGQYIAFYAKARYFGIADVGADIDEYDFELMNSEGDVFERPSLVMPEPDLDHHLYPGGDAEGWVILQAPEDTQDVILRFVPDYNENSPNTRYLSLLQYGR